MTRRYQSDKDKNKEAVEPSNSNAEQRRAEVPHKTNQEGKDQTNDSSQARLSVQLGA